MRNPLQDGLADELRPVVRTHEQRRAVQAHQVHEHLHHALGTDSPSHVDDQPLAGVFVHHGQALDLLAAGRGLENEVIGPDHVDSERRVNARADRSDALAWALPGYQPARLAPQPVRARPAQLEALAAQEHAEATIAVARILGRQVLHRREHRCILGRQAQLVAGRDV